MSLRYRATRKLVVAVANRSKSAVTVETLRKYLGPPTTKDDQIKGSVTSLVELGGVPAERYDAPDDSSRDGVLLCFHGGGYVAGTARNFRPMFASLARECGMTGYSIDYRLAPEHPFPAGLDDALSAYRALLDSGVSPDRVVMTGESAGGGLAVAAALATVEAGLPMPGALLLWWPFLDLTSSGASIDTNSGKDFLTRELIEMSAEAYLADADPLDPLASPLFADISGLPRMQLQVGEFDLLRSDSERFTELAKAARIPVELHVVRGAIHGFGTAGDGLPESRKAIRLAADWLGSTA